MRTIKYENNYAEVCKSAARYVLDNAPRGMRPGDRKSLQYKIDTADGGADTFYVEFERAERVASCTLSVSFDRNWGGERKEDSEGNLYRQHTIKVGVNWPSYGDAGAAVAMTRLALMREVTEFAAEVESAFSRIEVTELLATKAERDEATKPAAERAAQAKVAALANLSVKGMRVGASTVVVADHGLPLGVVEFGIADKGYRADVTTANGFGVTRVS